MNPIKPSEILDPNPERVRSHRGARLQTISLVPAPDLNGSRLEAARAPTVFAASFPTTQSRVSRWRLPLASTALNLLGQGVLGASIAIGTVDAAIGAGAAIGWTICGLVLIAAQCVSIAGRDPRHATEHKSGVTA